MKVKQLLTALTLSLALTAQAGFPGRTMSSQPSTEPVAFALETPTQPLFTEPAPEPAPASPLPAAESGPEAGGVPDEIANVPGVSEDWWAAVQEQIRADMYTLFSDTKEGGTPTYRGHNLAHNLDLSFTPAGLRLTPGQSAPTPPNAGPLHPSAGVDGQAEAAENQAASAEEQWTWGLRLSAYGYADSLTPAPSPAEVVLSGNRIEYHRDGITEWYVNEPRGLEHGFTINAPPQGHSRQGASLILELALETNLVPMMSADPSTDSGQGTQTIDFRLPNGNVAVLRYSELYVTDAAGRQLPAHFSLSPEGENQGEGKTIRIFIDDRQAAYPLIVDPLVTAPDWSATGEAASNLFGYAVSTAGDVNGDGFADVIIGAYGYDSRTGKVYVYHGSVRGLGWAADWSATGEAAGDFFGGAVGSAGDVNGDGFADVVVGAHVYNASTGKVYVYYGSQAGLSASAAWSATGEAAGDFFGDAVGSAGDVNGDGFADVVVGAHGNSSSTGKVYVYHGSAGGLGGSAAWTASGEAADDAFGYAVGTAGDVNGDGYGDVVVGAYRYDDNTNSQAGKAYVYHGSGTGLGSSAAWTATGEAASDYFGWAVSTAGDVNGDGYDDLVVGAQGYDDNANTDAGKAYLYHGSAAGLGGSAAWTASGEAADDAFGYAVGTAGDVNGDGYDDLVVGAFGYDDNTNSDAGKAYLYHGSAAGLGSSAAWTATGETASDNFGSAVSTAGDVNGDGYDDVVIGAPYNGQTGNLAGKAYSYHGSPTGLSNRHDWAASGENASDQFGWTVSTAGDVNGDGFADVLVGAPYYDQNGSDAGKVYLYYGSLAGLSETAAWAVVGEAFDDALGSALGTAGDVNGDGYDDVLIGAYGHNDDGHINAGRVYLFLGSAAGLSAAPAWVAAGQSPNDEFGRAVGTAGDVNGDGFADVIIGAIGYPGGSDFGRVYLYYGSETGLGEVADWSRSGEAAGDQFGSAVSAAGDVNGDGFADILIGAPLNDAAAENAGKAYLFPGAPEGLGESALWTGSGQNAYYNFGAALGGVGDVNGDGHADVLIGAPGSGDIFLYEGIVSGLGDSPDWTQMYAAGSVAVSTAGDVNGDGYADFLVGVAGDSDGRGLASLYLGSATGPIDSPFVNVTGGHTGDHFGWSVAAAGDVNGDGYSDFLIGEPGYDAPTMADIGRVTLYYGAGEKLSETATWSPSGENTMDMFGSVVRAAGDVNGDGYADVLVGAYYFFSLTGKVYLYTGSASGLSTSSSWSSTGENPSDLFASAVSAADVNGDGYADILVGAPFNGTEAGKVYLYYGAAGGPASGAADWTATGENAGDRFGWSVGTAGDVNGDGYADFLVGAPYRDENGIDSGKIYLYYGSMSGPASGAAGWTAAGSTSESLGWSVGTAGDVNGDGYADILAGAPHNGENGINAGKVYLYHGAVGGPASDAADWTALGESSNDYFGLSLSTAGDVNGDGYADVIVGAPGSYLSSPGKVYVYHGSTTGLDVAFWQLAEISSNANLGYSVSTTGDVNGDGYADVIIGAPGDNSNTGKASVYLGSTLGLRPSAAQVFTGSTSGELFGFSVDTAGDVNGDGIAEVIVGSPAYAAWQGMASLYPGNNGGGRLSLPLQLRGDGSGLSVQAWDATYEPNSFVVSLQAANPLGRSRGRLLVQVCPAGAAFGEPVCQEILSTQWYPADEEGILHLSEVVQRLEEDTLYRWRARVLFDSPFYSHTPWRRFQAQAQEADLRTGAPATDLFIRKTMVPTTTLTLGQPLTYTLEFGAQSAPAVGVVISDVLPTSLLSVTITSSGAPISDTGVSPGFVWQVGSLDVGQGGVITITGVANELRFLNTAIITSVSRDSNPANNTATVQTHIPGVLFVAQNAPGPLHNGHSWVTAYTDLQEALSVARSGDEIWVAEGVYKPTDTLTRTATFTLPSGVRIYGGFAGYEVYRYQRDWGAHPTLLSGDIGTPNTSADNVYHVVSAKGVGADSVLDGFIILGGNADGSSYPDNFGGGLYLDSSSPTLINLAFVGNTAADCGGGIATVSSSPTLINVAFSGNTATRGGGVCVSGGAPTLTNSTFSGNTADDSGGGVYSQGGSSVIVNSIFWGNTAQQGPQLYHTGPYTTTVSYSDVQGGYPGIGNLDADPMFYDADGADNIPGTLDDDLRLRHSSPVKDAGDNSALPLDTDDLDGDGDTSEPLPYDLSGRSRSIGFIVITPTVDMGAYEANILDVLADAETLLANGISFRMENLQLLSTDTLTKALQNYSNFNDGEWYYDFCADYDQIDQDGYCPANRPTHVRNDLLDTVALYRVALGWPTEVFTTARGVGIPVWEVGGQGVLAAVNEIANDHLVFGNEFLVDATDYRFSTAGIPNADQIISQELDELEQALQQFELIMKLVLRAYNEWGVGSYTNSDQFEQFGVASSLMMVALDEIATRYYMLGQSSTALEVYDRAYTEQYMQLLALAALADETGADYLLNGSWEMLNNLSRMRARAQAIHDGLDFFGFAPDYVPLQAYEQLLELTEGPTGDTGLLGTARDLEDQAREAQRTFDANASDMATELDNLTVELNDQLFELCGESQDDYETCEGGLMGQNLQDMYEASLRIGLAWLRAQNIAEQVQIEEERAGRVIQVDLGLGKQISATKWSIGKLQAYRETRTQAYSSENQLHLGVEATARVYFGVETKAKASLNPFANEASVTSKAGFEVAVEGSFGYQHAWTWTKTTEKVWDPNAQEIGKYESILALKEAEAQAAIEGANSAAVVKNLLLAQSEALQEYEIAMAEFNKLAAEHNYLAERRSRLLNKREQAINRVISHNSHLLSPAYRLWRDSLTTQSALAHGLAAQFAYLTARAAEYELLTPYPNLSDIFRARTSNDIRLFLDDLKVWYQALNRPGQLNRYPYTISLAEDIWGLTDQALDPDGTMTEDELEQARYEQFQALLQESIRDGQLEIWFSTSLDQRISENQYLFSPNIWNNRIAGIGMPLADNQGVWINLVISQPDVTDDLEVVLIHGGQAGGAEAYRNAAGETVYYDPDTAVPVGYVLPDELDPANTTVVLRPGINGVGAIANSGLLNLSVAASMWTLRIPSDSKGNLDYSQLRDIELHLDTTGRALPGREALAEQDALLLQAGMEMAPLTSEQLSQLAEQQAREQGDGARAVTQPEQEISAPAIPGEIGGAYFGSVIITSPITVGLQVLDVVLWNNLDGTITGTVDVGEASLYSGTIELNGVVSGDLFTVTSSLFPGVVAGWPVTQSFTLVGYAVEGGEILKADYTGVITNLLPSPTIVQGRFSGSRPATPGSERLRVRAGNWSLPLEGSTIITATLFDEAMRVITETRRITFTTNLGTVIPSVMDSVDGLAVVTFAAGDTPGQATIIATTGEITSTARLNIEQQAAPVVLFLPIIRKSPPPLREPAPDLVVDTVSVTGGSVQVVIKNQGNAPVPADSMFWVDLYVDPDPVPDGVNQSWASLCYEGIVWGVPLEALPLDPGAVITLTYSTAPDAPNLYYYPDLSNFFGSLAAGTPVYVQVDSWKPNTSSGAVLESHEIAGGTYNNILGPVPSMDR